MANQEHLDILKQGAQVWNKWIREHPGVRADLSEADLRGAQLRGAHLGGADLSGADLRVADLGGADLSGADLRVAYLSEAYLREADFRGAYFRGAYLRGAYLRGADLRKAHLSGAHLSGAYLRGAYLRGAQLRGADLNRADLRRAHLREAVLHETVFGDTRLTETKGLDSCRHEGPCTIDHRTLAKSGKLPMAFLRGCGLPDALIDYLPALLGDALQFYSCFISYSSKDQDFAERLHADLQNKGVRCWFAPHDIRGGEKIHEQIDQAIRVYDRLLLILSPHSMNSEWVKTEIANARKRELKEGKRVLFPVRLVDFEKIKNWECFDADTGKDSAREIREYFVPDFSNWKDHDAYQKALGDLIRDLKQEAEKGVEEKQAGN